ncbi:DMT family transporter [bacterium]|nr:DMT family transporter [bacterium]
MPFAALTGYLALLGRTVGLGLERPFVKALSRNRDSIAATTVYFGIGELLLVPLILWQWAHDPAYAAGIGGWIGWALLSGLIYAVSFHVYVYGMSVGEVSLLAPLYATMFLWLYLMDILWGEAVFGWLQLAGILAVMTGVVFLNIAPGRNLAQVLNPLTVIRQPGAWGMLVYAFGLALGRMVDKQAADIAPPVLYAFIDNAPCVLGGILLLALRGRAGRLIALGRERFWIAVVGSFAGMYAYVLMLVALDYFNPSVVEPVTQLSVLLAVGLGAWWFKEPLRARWVAALLVAVGAVLLLLG